MDKKKIVFITGTRADFGKLKSLIEIARKSPLFEIHIFATGMHMNSKYGKTVNEIVKCGYDNIFTFINHNDVDRMDLTLAKTTDGFSHYVNELKPDMIVVHGDRVEALAGAIVGAINNILVAHIEGGEVSGTVDEFLRHSISKIAHLHFVSNEEAKNRLVRMGEDVHKIFVIGSPDIDIMDSDTLPDLAEVKQSYEIKFNDYAILLFHPVTTEVDKTNRYANDLVDALVQSKKNYVVFYPNNDHGSESILNSYERFSGNKNIRLIPSMRFESFLVLLKNAKFIIGNSSAGIREAPYYGVPTINIGTRQRNRAPNRDIFNCGHRRDEILDAISRVENIQIKKSMHFGKGNSNKLFFDIINNSEFWNTSKQKQFNDNFIHI